MTSLLRRLNMSKQLINKIIVGFFWMPLMLLSIAASAAQQGVPSLAPMLEDVTPAVVSIRVTKQIAGGSRQFPFSNEQIPEELRRFFPEGSPQFQRERPQRRASGAGSGVVIDADQGYVVTNHHVIDSASEVTIILQDGRNFAAQLLGSDPSTDLALLKIEAENLVGLPFADIDSVKVGDYAVAIGNPFGIGQTVTSGIVSALGRAGLNRDNYEDFIQTDAAINVGNSGGALIDLEGNLIGINTAIISGNGGSNGIGFAVPVDMVAAVVEHLERDGEVRRGMLGVMISDINTDIATALDLQVSEGALITDVMPGSAAEQAGIQVSDIVIELNGEVIRNMRQLRNSVGLRRLNDEVDLTIQRGDERLSLTARIGSSEGGLVAGSSANTNPAEFRGASLRASADGRGVEVAAVQADSAAWNGGLRAGDTVISVNRQSVSSLQQFNNVVSNHSGVVALTILREGREMILLLS